MQIDFHHAATYALARLAGYAPGEAATIAYAAQYVDDATNAGVVRFTNGAMYSRIASAHKMLDYRNFEQLANHTAWTPFHFLPGNGGAPAGEDPGGSFIDKLVCLPDSPVARDMLDACYAARGRPYALHYLGIALHVYADTFAHQRFAGVSHAINHVHDVEEQNPLGWGLGQRLKSAFGDLFDDTAARFIDGVLPLGHGAALSNPDKPFLKWSYLDGRGARVRRDNPRIFTEAARRMFEFIARFRGVPAALAPADDAALQGLFAGLLEDDGDARHARWLERIAAGAFSFGPERVAYVAKGKGSWKHAALDTDKGKDDEDEKFPFRAHFLTSDWQLFHTALQHHRLAVLRDILPRYGICAA